MLPGDPSTITEPALHGTGLNPWHSWRQMCYYTGCVGPPCSAKTKNKTKQKKALYGVLEVYLTPVLRGEQTGGSDFGLPLQGSCAQFLLPQPLKPLVMLFVPAAHYSWEVPAFQAWI